MTPVGDRVRSHVAGSRVPAAVVVDVSWVNGLAAVRSLGRAGAPVIALDHRRSALGFRSRYALGLVCPDPGVEEAEFVRLLVEIGDALGRPTPIFPTHDEQVNAIARNRGELGDRYLCPFPDWAVLAKIQSKRFQLESALAAGVAVPATAHPSSSTEARAAGEALGYPVLVKPSDPTGFKRAFGRQAFRCDDQAGLEHAYRAAEPYAPMVQELIPGGDECLYTFGSYVNEDGEALGLFSGRKLRQTPPGVGTCRVGEAVWVEEAVEQGLRLLRRVGFHGISQVEFKRDPRDGVYKLMEINPRLWQWHGLAAACGVDLSQIAYRDLLGRPQTAVRMNGAGKRWAISLMSGSQPAFLRPPYVDAVFSLDDPLPAVAQAVRLVRGALR